jgi:hypothetical protein
MCNICGKSVTSLGNYMNHMRMYSGEKEAFRVLIIFVLRIVMKVALFYTQNRSESSTFLHEKSY